jgi:branched-chain amino acid aminotransferase
VRIVWLDGALVAPARAALPIDDPAVRWGEGLFETMRADNGSVPLLERHLARLAASAAALGLPGMPEPARSRAAVAEALGAFGDGPARVRLTASPRPTLLVEVTALAPGPATATAVSVRGAWLPGDPLAEHKTLSYARHRLRQRAAAAAGADHALLLDDSGRLGEAALASAFCAIDGALVTAPARGLLAGVARALVLERIGGREEAPGEAAWRGASEIILTNALRGAIPVISVDGRRVGDGRPGPWARRLAQALGEAPPG